MIQPISVPFAPLIFKVVAGIPLFIVGLLSARWGVGNLKRCVQMWQGILPLPARSSRGFVLVGSVLSLLVLAAGGGALYFDLALVTTQPTIISQDGILVGAGPPVFAGRSIRWLDVTKVTCNKSPRDSKVRTVEIYSNGAEVKMGNAGAILEDVISIAMAKTPGGTVQPCETSAFDHSWSY